MPKVKVKRKQIGQEPMLSFLLVLLYVCVFAPFFEVFSNFGLFVVQFLFDLLFVFDFKQAVLERFL